MQKTELTSHKQYLFGFLVSRNTNKAHTGQIILPGFFAQSEKELSQAF